MHTVDGLQLWEALGPAYFRELSSFGALPDEVIRNLLEDGRVISLDAGDTLYTAGNCSDAFYIILRGAINTFMPYQGGWSLVRCHEVGEDMGFAAMIALRDRAASTIAKVDSVVLEITSSHFFTFHERKPNAFGLMLLNLTRGMARAIIDMATVLAEKDGKLPF